MLLFRWKVRLFSPLKSNIVSMIIFDGAFVYISVNRNKSDIPFLFKLSRLIFKMDELPKKKIKIKIERSKKCADLKLA